MSFIASSFAQTSENYLILTSGRVAVSPAKAFPRTYSDEVAGSVLAATADATQPASDADQWKQFIICCPAGTSEPFKTVRAKLVAKEVRVVEYLGNDTCWLIFGKQTDIVAIAAGAGSLLGTHEPGAKLSPATKQVISDLDAAAGLWRRSLEEAGQLGEATSVTATASSTFESSYVPPSLKGLQTWTFDPSATSKPASVVGLFESSSQTAATTDKEDKPPPPPSPPPPSADQDELINLYCFTVRLIAEAPREMLGEVLTKWPTAIALALGRKPDASDFCRPRIVDAGLFTATSTSVVHVFFCKGDVKNGANWLAEKELVTWVDPLPKSGSNNAIANWILQSGDLNSSTYNDPTSGSRPYWNAGIQGQGIIVGTGDTGIDMSHCYFIDDNFRPGSLRAYFSTSSPRLYLPYHRKIVQYVLPEISTIQDWFGDAVGHGTAIAGSIAGAIQDDDGSISNDRATGVAPRARLSFFDYNSRNFNGINPPRPYDNNILPYHYGVGARVNAETWTLTGYQATRYMEDSRQFDGFAWRNPDFLSVISAGNYGTNRGMISVVAPANAKNILSVGASLNHPKGVGTSAFNRAILFLYRDSRGVTQLQPVWPALRTELDDWTRALDRERTLKLANPEHACTALSGNYTGSIVLVDRAVQNCSRATRAANSAAAGASGVIFIARDEGFAEEDALGDASATEIIANGVICKAQGLAIRTVLRTAIATTNPRMTLRGFPALDYGIDSILPYSSAGPTHDNRWKPDIVAPGGPVVSTWADPDDYRPEANSNTCSASTSEIQGTSTSAASAAGALALMSQYFRDGFYPTGAKLAPESVPFAPTGMLLKAGAITGAHALSGGVALGPGRPLGNAPDGWQGWGRLDLTGALPLPGVTPPNFRIQVVDNAIITDGQYIYLRGLRATGTGPIFATLVWHDYPASGAALQDLVNDLDFGVQVNVATPTTVYSRNRTDSTNNVERIELTAPRARDALTFVVHGRAIRHSLLTNPDAQYPQRFAVFVAGHFTGTLRSQQNPSYVTPQRLQPGNPPVTSLTIRVPSNGTCARSGADGNIQLSSGACVPSSSVFSFEESIDNRTGGYLYTIKDNLGKCLQMNANNLGWRAIMVTCARSPNQLFAIFRSQAVIGRILLAPSISLGTGSDDRRCLRQSVAAVSPTSNITTLILAACNEEDLFQNLQLDRPASVAVSPPLPPSPPPPNPSPARMPDKQWYPYPLLFRTDFYPVNGTPNQFEYDYAAWGDASTLSYVDIVVAWSVGGVRYQIGINDLFVINAPAGVVYGGDNTDILKRDMYEYIFFKTGFTPPSTQYDICVSWAQTETPRTRIKLTVYRGYAVATATKILDTSSPVSTLQCSNSSVGYVASYNFSSQSLDPPMPPSPPPPAVTSRHPLYIQVDWMPISGIVGREGRLVDLDLTVAWTAQGIRQRLGLLDQYPGGGGGNFSGDNSKLANRGNTEFAFWQDGSPPPAAILDVCVTWYGTQKPVVEVTLTILVYGQQVQRVVKTLDTTLPRARVCNSEALGYLGSIDLSNGLNAPPPPPAPPVSPSPPPPSSCNPEPVPAPNIVSLYLKTDWGAGTTTTTRYDWDMVVAWTANGQEYELSRYNRFVGGGVYAGDNIELPGIVNGEVAYWPTGLTGVAPVLTNYHVCVRWFSAGTLTVTVTVNLGQNVVKTASAIFSSTALNGKVCAPGQPGYVSSYTYTGANVSALVASTAATGSWGNFAGASSSDRAGGNKADSDTLEAKEPGTVDDSDPAAVSPSPSPAAAVPQAAGDGQAGANSGAQSQSSDSGHSNAGAIVGITLGCVFGVALVVGVTVLAVRWRREKLRNTRVVSVT